MKQWIQLITNEDIFYLVGWIVTWAESRWKVIYSTSYKLIIFLKNGIEAIERIKKILTPLTDDVLKAYKYAHWHTYCDFLNTIVGSNNIKNYPEEYKKLKKISRKEALCTLNSPIPIKDKIKGILYFLNPYLAVIFINYFRKREFTNEEE